MSAVSVLYLRAHAYHGDPCSWSAQLNADEPATDPAEPVIQYDTRRLDRMVACAIEALRAALARAGASRDESAQMGVVGLSHNGPCIYSEDFCRQLMTEPDPQLVSPMLFAESVLNIVPTHISLALKTNRPMYALNPGLAHFYEALDLLYLLAGSGAWTQAVCCVSEEFSNLADALLARCPDIPGQHFRNGAIATVWSIAPPSGPHAVAIERPVFCAAAAAPAALAAARAAGVRRIVRSAYSTAPAAGLDLEPSPIGDDVMQNEQGFMVTRMAELLDCARLAASGTSTALVQTAADAWRWLVARPA